MASPTDPRRFAPLPKTRLSRLRKLQTRKGREEASRFLAEGPKVIEEAIRAGLVCHTLAVVESRLTDFSRLEIPADRVFFAGDKEFRFVCGTQTPQGLLAEFERPPALPVEKIAESVAPLLVLDEIQDPGNVGTAVRCAAGLGCGGVLLTKGSVDLWNPKTVRASAGALFRVPTWEDLDPRALIRLLQESGFRIWIADARGESLFELAEIPRRLAIVFGNEARGARAVWDEFPGARRIGIPLTAGVDSLNVGAAVAAMLTGLKFIKPSK